MNDRIALGLFFLGLGIIIGFFPTFLAHKRHHPNILSIFVLNFFTGWTGIGWICSLVWACSENTLTNKYLPEHCSTCGTVFYGPADRCSQCKMPVNSFYSLALSGPVCASARETKKSVSRA